MSVKAFGNYAVASNGEVWNTKDDVAFIRRHHKAYDKKFGTGALAKKFGVARQTISSEIITTDFTKQ